MTKKRNWIYEIFQECKKSFTPKEQKVIDRFLLDVAICTAKVATAANEIHKQIKKDKKIKEKINQ